MCSNDYNGFYDEFEVLMISTPNRHDLVFPKVTDQSLSKLLFTVTNFCYVSDG